MAPSGILAIRAGQQRVAGFQGRLRAGRADRPCARARLRLPVDQSLAEDGTFVRPIPTRAVLYGLNDDDDDNPRLAIAELQSSDGELVVSNTTLLTPIVQRILLQPDTAFDRYELGFVRGTASLNIFPLVLPDGVPATSARFTLTVVGGSN